MDDTLISLDVASWVEESASKEVREFREAVRLILQAISGSDQLSSDMIVKGGVLLAIRYKTGRSTRDIDFSTNKKFEDNLADKFIADLSQRISEVVAESESDIDLNIQSCKKQPHKEDATFPSLKIKIGYAIKGSPSHKKLVAKQCSTIVEIDYSFNEQTPYIDRLAVDGGELIMAYSFADLIAEKYRAVIQQMSEHRGRVGHTRRQDIFDLNFLISEASEINDYEKRKILQSAIIKSRSRNIEININSLDNEEVFKKSKEDYATLQDEIEGELPDFDESYNRVNEFYKKLPWGALEGS